ncbi:MAG: alanine racemase [Parcubacteria group bacterium Gr01-1014_3]|nr:MAG: alanine racemase [Parcubacteria group bacterium Gr01-1014_3]
MSTPNLKVWVEIDKAAAKHNYQKVRSLIDKKTKLWSVVKSNAYGHGLAAFASLINELGADGFCVDSVIEGVKLREQGIRKPILVLGPTFPGLLADAVANDIMITISNFDALDELNKSKFKPKFHLKLDTGMHRQGFYLDELPEVISTIKNLKFKIENCLTGAYTHFASAKDINYPTFTDLQFAAFRAGIEQLEKAGFKNLIRHCAASGATVIDKKYHLDAVRTGIALYGLWPSKELDVQLSDEIELKPVLSWHALVSEVKDVEVGDYVGYDLTERMVKDGKIAVIPIGYWHGFPRALSGVGEVLINGDKAKVLGRVSMDMIVVDVSDIKCERGDVATLIGKNLPVYKMAEKIGASHYELITRINPLIERVVQ